VGTLNQSPSLAIPLFFSLIYHHISKIKAKSLTFYLPPDAYGGKTVLVEGWVLAIGGEVD
jgi:hypothetical protein